MPPNIIQIQEPQTKAEPKAELAAFLELGFRPLYIAGCSWAFISLAIWVFFPGLLNGPLLGFMWHSHEMLWGYIATIAVGFLLTAGKTWTGITPLDGKLLALLCLFWLLARIGLLIDNQSWFWLGCASELIFFGMAFIAMLRVVVQSKNYRNMGLPPALLGLTIADALFLYYAYDGDSIALIHYFNLGMLCMAVIALLIGRRIIPFFAMRAVAGLQIPRHGHSGQVQLTLCSIATGLAFFQCNTSSAILLATCALITLYQLLSWKPLAVRKVPLLWVLYIGYFFLGLGLLAFAAHLLCLEYSDQFEFLDNFFWLQRAAWPVHLIAIGGFSVLIIGMVTRTSLGHLGRPLKTNRLMAASFVCIILATVFRVLSLSTSHLTLTFLHSAALCWIIGFCLFVWHFTPLLIRPHLSKVSGIKLNVVTINKKKN